MLQVFFIASILRCHEHFYDSYTSKTMEPSSHDEAFLQLSECSAKSFGGMFKIIHTGSAQINHDSQDHSSTLREDSEEAWWKNKSC